MLTVFLDILDNQALPIPENVEAEKKVVFKPPIPEKPSGSPSYKATPEKLEIFVFQKYRKRTFYVATLLAL